jgi:hypothetical protein
MLHFEHEKTEKEIEIERDREAREMFKQREIQRRQDKTRRLISFGWRLPIAGSDVNELDAGSGGTSAGLGAAGAAAGVGDGSGVYALVTILRAPAPACVELRVSVPKTGGSMGMLLTEDQLWEQHMPPPPTNAGEAWNKKWGQAMVDRLAVDYMQEKMQQHGQLMRLVLQPPLPMAQQSVCMACGERRGITRQHYMKLQMWRIESELTPPALSSAALGAPKADRVRIVAWDPSGGNQHRAAVGAELALDLSEADQEALRIALPKDGCRLLPETRQWWLGQLARTLELVPVAPPLTAAPGVFASMRLNYSIVSASAPGASTSVLGGGGGVGRGSRNVGSHKDTTDRLIHQKTRRFGNEAWLISVRLMGVNASASSASLTASGVLSDDEDDESDLLMTAVTEDQPGTSQGLGKSAAPRSMRSMTLRLLVSSDKVTDYGGARRVVDAVQLVGGVLTLPTPRVLLKQGVRFEDEKSSYQICSVIEELGDGSEYAGGVRVEGYEFATCTSCELRLRRTELVELTLLSQTERVQPQATNGAQRTPHSMNPLRCKALLAMLQLQHEPAAPGRSEKTRLQLKPANEIHAVLREQAEDAKRADAAIAIQSKIRQGKAKAEAGDRLEEMAAAERAARIVILYSEGVSLGDGSEGKGAACIVSMRSSQAAMEEIMPTMDVLVLDVEAGAMHRLDGMPGPRWTADQEQKNKYCSDFISQLALLALPLAETPDDGTNDGGGAGGGAGGRKVLRRRQPLDRAKQEQLVEEWKAEPMAAFAKMIEADNLDGLRHILDTVQDSANARFVDNHTPLHLAAADGNLQFVKVLVDGGADVNAVTESFNATAPMYAIPGTIASGADGMGDAARMQTLSYLLAVPALDPGIRGTGGWCEGMSAYDVAGAHGVL